MIHNDRLTESKREVIRLAELFVKEQLGKDASGHDWWHIHRVRQIAVRIAAEEGADAYLCELAALLHDVADEKLNESKEAGLRKVSDWLAGSAADADTIAQVIVIIATMSYNGGHNPPMESLEGRIVQDADRLDAIGAIGIARTFAYAGWKGHLIYDPEQAPRESLTEEQYRGGGTAIQHFYEKLLRLKGMMNTEYGQKMAEKRHQFMLDYLDRFYDEWEARE